MPSDIYTERDGVIYRALKITTNQFGYKFVKLTNNDGKRTLYIHRIMYRTFVGAIPSNMEINHIDHDKSNNCISNLELVTHKDNLIKAAKFHGYKSEYRCKSCNKKVSRNAAYCKSCAIDKKRSELYGTRYKYEHPSKDVLWRLIKSMPMTSIGNIYSVSDNAIRKLAKKYGLPYRKRDIERQKEKENLLLDSRCIGES